MQVTFVQVWDEIVHDLPDVARPALEAFLATGLADIHHIMNFANLTRDRAIRIAERLVSAELVRRPGMAIKRPDKRGQPASVYLLAENGAQTLQLLGHEQARGCNLKGDLPILHALVMTDIHLAARKAGVTIETDRVLKFNTREIRPDHLVILGWGRKIIFEIEQQASLETLRRIMESLSNKQHFFESKAHPEVISEVRMILNMNRGAQWDRTLSVWEKALGMVQEEAGGRLSFRLFAITRREFLDAPDWEEDRHLPWREVLPLRQKPLTEEVQQNAAIPKWVQNSPREQRLILLSYWQVLQESAQQRDSHLGVNPFLLENMRLIYSASHDEAATPREQVALPHRSLKMLDEYLKMMALHKPLNAVLHAMDAKTKWNPTMIMQRMQIAIAVFLRQHGWRADGPLQVFPQISNWESRASEQFYVRVEIRNPFLLHLQEERDVEPSQDEV